MFPRTERGSCLCQVDRGIDRPLQRGGKAIGRQAHPPTTLLPSPLNPNTTTRVEVLQHPDIILVNATASPHPPQLHSLPPPNHLPPPRLTHTTTRVEVSQHPDIILDNATIKALIGDKCDGVIGQLTEVSEGVSE